MITKVFTIFDLKAQCYNVPFVLRTNGEALRVFSDMANDPQSRIGQHPEDYVLYAIAEFDDDRGIVKPLSPQEILGKAAEFVRYAARLPLFSEAEEAEIDKLREGLKGVSVEQQALEKEKG